MHWYQPVLYAYVRHNFSVAIHNLYFARTVLIRTKAGRPLQFDTDAVLTRTVVMQTPTDFSAELLVQYQFVLMSPGIIRQLRSLFAERVKFRVQMNCLHQVASCAFGLKNYALCTRFIYYAFGFHMNMILCMCEIK